jgi:putative hemolysin
MRALSAHLTRELPAAMTPDQRTAPHIVDQLIGERAPTLYGLRPTRWALRKGLGGLLRYEEAVRLADAVAPLPGRAALGLVEQLLDLRLEVRGLEHVPETGRVLIVPNHPTGLADGIALFQALRPRRPDLRFFVNRDALRVAPGFADLFIPVAWVKSRRSHAGSRDVFRQTAEAFRHEAAVVVFASGRLAHLTWRGIRERPWVPTAINLARRHHAPLLPLHIKARNSVLFYALSQVSTELRDITLFRELLNKAGRAFELTFGPLLDPAALPPDPAVATRELQHYVEDLLPGSRPPRARSEWRRAPRPGTLLL